MDKLNLVPCSRLTGVGPKVAEKLQRLGLHTVQDLLFHLPFRYQDRTRVTPLNQLEVGEYAVVEGNIIEVSKPNRFAKTRLLCKLSDGHRFLNLRFFYINASQEKQLAEGSRLRCFGEVRFGPKGIEMVHPSIEVEVEETLTPIYPATDGLSQLMIRKLTDRALVLLEKSDVVEIIPQEILQKLSFPTLKDAIRFLHRPALDQSVEVYQKRLVFEELIAHRLSLVRLKNSFQQQKSTALPQKNSLREDFLKQLPFQLTQAQLRVAKEIEQDLEKNIPMLRLIQGDVGSGKTIVAALAALQAVENDYQVALIAPTEILAEQHYRNFEKWLTPLNIKIALLTSRHKESLLDAQIVVGTHAVFQKDVNFSKLALVIIDEQHRFGVEQRADLRAKGVYGDCYPHQLMMTATPIPRTLAMSIYADLDCSTIDELPPGRTPVITSVIPNTRRDEMVMRIRDICKNGQQVYWVCTLIEESEDLQCQAAEKAAELLRSALPELTIGLVHGRLKPQEKESIMQAFKASQIHLLVATTVIEVGVDVPNASLMIIENAERLGLSQLHQLRGRVGRGSLASHCVLMYQSPLSQMAKSRLAIMRETNDGFKISERDLELRGPGEVLGTRQTGEVRLRIADLLRDSDLLPLVQEAGNIIMHKYPDSIAHFIARWLGKNEQYSKV